MTANEAAPPLTSDSMPQVWRERLVESPSPYAYCLPLLLDKLGWRGNPRELAAAVAGTPEGMDLVDFRNTLVNLKFRSWRKRTDPTRVETRLLPCLYVDRVGYPSIIDIGAGGELEYGNAAGKGPARALKRGGCAYYVAPLTASISGTGANGFWNLLYRFQNQIVLLYAASLLINLLSLVVPFYLRAIYNLVIPSGSSKMLYLLCGGAALGVVVQALLLKGRAQLLARLGARLDLSIGRAVMERLMGQSLSQLEAQSPVQHMAQLRSFESLRAYITGPFALAALDLPFVPIFLVAIVATAHWLALIPVVAIALVLGAVYLLRSYGQAKMRQFLRQNQADTRNLLLEMVQRFLEIKAHALEPIWLARLRSHSAQSVFGELKQARLQGSTQILASDFGRLAGALTLGVGAGLAMAGQSVNLGNLIAAMFFVWRFFGPIQMAFSAFSRFGDLKPSLDRLNALLASPIQEGEGPAKVLVSQPRLKGQIEFSHVTVRFNPTLPPALIDVSFTVKPGELVAIAGREGSGKSTLLKLLVQLYPLLSGSICLDGLDIHQIPLASLRTNIGFLPSKVKLFPGTVYENLILANPTATQAAVQKVCHRIGLLPWIDGVGWEAPISGRMEMGESFAPAQMIGLARVLLTEAPILALDDPTQGLGAEQLESLLATLQQRRGQSTLLISTLYPPILEMADRILVLHRGAVAFNGTPRELNAT